MGTLPPNSVEEFIEPIYFNDMLDLELSGPTDTQRLSKLWMGTGSNADWPDVYSGTISEDQEWLRHALLEYLCIGESANLSRVMWTVSNWSALIMWWRWVLMWRPLMWWCHQLTKTTSYNPEYSHEDEDLHEITLMNTDHNEEVLPAEVTDGQVHEFKCTHTCAIQSRMFTLMTFGGEKVKRQVRYWVR